MKQHPFDVLTDAHHETVEIAQRGFTANEWQRLSGLHKWLHLPVENSKQRSDVHLLLYYFPVIKGEHTVEYLKTYSPDQQLPTGAEGVNLTLQTLWQELGLPGENLDGTG